MSDLFGNIFERTQGFGGALDELLGVLPGGQAARSEQVSPLERVLSNPNGAWADHEQPLTRYLQPNGMLAFVLGDSSGTGAAADQRIASLWGNERGGAFGDYSFTGKKTLAARQRDGEAPPSTIAPSAAPSGTSAPGTPGQGWGSPTTGQLDEELAGSPLAGQGALIAQIAAQHGVPVTVAMAILKQESSYGRHAANTFNYGGLTGGDPATGNRFRAFGSLAEGLNAVIGNMGSGLYRGKTISQFMQTYAPSSDGNDTNAYINNILTLDHKWGGHSDWNTVVVGNAPVAPVAGPPGGGAAGYAFPVVGFQGKVDLHHGASQGAADLFAPRGTAVVAMRGGTVVDASYNSLGGNTVTIRGDDGLLYYYAHLDQAPTVAAGQTIQAGQQFGVVGDSGNARGTGTHLHLGIGRDILSGAGADGGAGTPWGSGPTQNASGLLTWVLGGAR